MNQLLIECLEECAERQRDKRKQAIIYEMIRAMQLNPLKVVRIIKERLNITDSVFIGKTIREAAREASTSAEKKKMADLID